MQPVIDLLPINVHVYLSKSFRVKLEIQLNRELYE